VLSILKIRKVAFR